MNERTGDKKADCSSIAYRECQAFMFAEHTTQTLNAPNASTATLIRLYYYLAIAALARDRPGGSYREQTLGDTVKKESTKENNDDRIARQQKDGSENGPLFCLQ